MLRIWLSGDGAVLPKARALDNSQTSMQFDRPKQFSLLMLMNADSLSRCRRGQSKGERSLALIWLRLNTSIPFLFPRAISFQLMVCLYHVGGCFEWSIIVLLTPVQRPCGSPSVPASCLYKILCLCVERLRETESVEEMLSVIFDLQPVKVPLPQALWVTQILLE